MSRTFSPKEIYVTENGVDVPGEVDLRLPDVLRDTFRINYFSAYLEQLALAVSEDHVPLKGYMAWSILDNFEWHDGFSKLFGIVWIDRQNNLTRHPKDSSSWWTTFLKT